jgi:ATP-dependent RNA helicase DDX51/DBP6
MAASARLIEDGQSDQRNKRPKIDRGNEDPPALDPKHAGLFERFKKVVGSAAGNLLKVPEDERHDKEKEAVNVNELGPLPQPEIERTKHKKSNQPLPWMNEPVYIPPETSIGFRELGCLSDRLLVTLEGQGYKSAFAIQTEVIPQLVNDNNNIAPDPLPDILVNSYTGSGKTLAYGVPIVEALSTRVVPRVRALIILPTKPLIQQVRAVMEELSRGTGLSSMVLRTERPFKEEQKAVMQNKPDIIITTPGRLVDHIRHTDSFTLKYLKYLVIDEADRLLNQSFQEWVNVVVSALEEARPEEPMSEKWYRPPQKLVFSATLTRDPGKLASLNIRSNSKVFIVGDQSTESVMNFEFSLPRTLKEYMVPAKSLASKPLRLMQLLTQHDMLSNTIIFTKSNESAARLARLATLLDELMFHRNLVIERCSGEMSLDMRKKTLRLFTQGDIGVLVCTDLIARGIDISTVQNVINYDLPNGEREYVHRVGRTARAGNEGSAWSLVCGQGDRNYFNTFSKKIYRESEVLLERLPADHGEEEDDRYKVALQKLQDEVFDRT